MKIDICEIMNRRLDRVDFSYKFDPRHTDAVCVILPDDISVPDDGISVTGSVTDSLGCMTFRASVCVHYITACARCLDEVCGELSFSIERLIVTDGGSKNDLSRLTHLDDGDEWDGTLDDVLYVNEARVIPDADIMEELSLELPPFTLCSEDCPGLCPRCGKHLRDGDCGCREKKEIDPRLAILQKLLENQE